MSIFRQLKRGDVKALQFYFGIEHHELRLVCDAAYTPCVVSIAWIHGSRREEIKRVRILRSSSGSNVFLQLYVPAERLMFPVTLYSRQVGDQVSEFLPKYWTVQVEEVKRSGSRKVLADVAVNLAAFAGERHQSATNVASDRRAMHLNPAKRHAVLSCELQLTVASICVDWVDDLYLDDEDVLPETTTVAETRDRDRDRNESQSSESHSHQSDAAKDDSSSLSDTNAPDASPSNQHEDSPDDEDPELDEVDGSASSDPLVSRRLLLSRGRGRGSGSDVPKRRQVRIGKFTGKSSERDRLTLSCRRSTRFRNSNLLLSCDEQDENVVESPVPVSPVDGDDDTSTTVTVATAIAQSPDVVDGEDDKSTGHQEKEQPSDLAPDQAATDKRTEDFLIKLAILSKPALTIMELESQNSLMQELLSWTQSQLSSYRTLRVTNFTTSFRNGLVLCGILYNYLPKLIPDFESMKAVDMLENNRRAFRILQVLGIETAGLRPADIVDVLVVNKLKVASIVLQIQHYFQEHPSDNIFPLSLPLPTSNPSPDDNDTKQIANQNTNSNSDSESDSNSDRKVADADANAKRCETGEDNGEGEDQGKKKRGSTRQSFADAHREQIVDEMRKQAYTQCRKDTLLQLYARRESVAQSIALAQNKGMGGSFGGETLHEENEDDNSELVLNHVTAHASARMAIVEDQLRGVSEQMKTVERRLLINAKHREQVREKLRKSQNWRELFKKKKKRKQQQRAQLLAGLSTVDEDENEETLLPAAYDEDTVMMQWLGLIDWKNELTHERECLKLVIAEEHFAKRERQVRDELQQLGNIADWSKSPEQQSQESQLLEELLKIIKQRNELVELYHQYQCPSQNDE